MKVFKLTSENGVGKLISKNIDDLLEEIRQGDLDEVDYHIESIEMSEDEYKNLTEFEGF